MSRPIHYQFEFGPEGSLVPDVITGPFQAPTLKELVKHSLQLFTETKIPESFVGTIDWYDLWYRSQESDDGSFYAATLRWPGRWFRVSPLSSQDYENAMIRGSVSAKTLDTLADELAARRELMASVVESFYPADQIIFRAMSGAWTGAEMAALIRAGDEIGRHYAESILMVCRDALARQADKGGR